MTCLMQLESLVTLSLWSEAWFHNVALSQSCICVGGLFSVFVAALSFILETRTVFLCKIR